MIHPDDTYTIYLDDETPEAERRPEPERPALVYRYGTLAELNRHEDDLEALQKLSGKSFLAELERLAANGLIATRNLAASSLSAALALPEIAALAYGRPHRCLMALPDKKKSESPSPTPAAAAAGPAGREANA